MTSPSGQPARVLLVDDHPVVRDGLAEAINHEPGLLVCAVAADRPEAVAAAETSKPDLAVVDLLLKNSNGLELIKDLHARWPRLLILVVSMQEETLYAERALRAGARGYFTKQQATRNILSAVHKVLNGGIYLSDKMSSSVLAHLAASPEGNPDSIAEALSDRELQVFELTGTGLSTRGIAERLHVDLRTVETYRGRIREKLNLKDGSELLQLAIRWNKERGEGNAP